ncbi:MAG: ABC transporter substrate-binding protein, partial [Limnohabitans sp.]
TPSGTPKLRSVMAALFDQTITFRLKELQAATKAIHAAEAALAKKPNATASELLKQAREAAFSPVVNAQKAADKEFLALFAANKKDAAVSKSVTGLENYWSNSARQNYERAKSLAEQALAAVK